MISIVATETSTATFLSVPGVAYKENFTFLQLAFGYILGRVVVATVLLPAYFRGRSSLPINSYKTGLADQPVRRHRCSFCLPVRWVTASGFFSRRPSFSTLPGRRTAWPSRPWQRLLWFIRLSAGSKRDLDRRYPIQRLYYRCCCRADVLVGRLPAAGISYCTRPLMIIISAL